MSNVLRNVQRLMTWRMEYVKNKKSCKSCSSKRTYTCCPAGKKIYKGKCKDDCPKEKYVDEDTWEKCSGKCYSCSKVDSCENVKLVKSYLKELVNKTVQNELLTKIVSV